MPAEKIAKFNDRFRKGDPTISGKSFVTAGIIQLLTEQNIPIAELADLMIAYSDFTEENDPYGEHDFGAFAMGGEKCFWKIEVVLLFRPVSSVNKMNLISLLSC